MGIEFLGVDLIYWILAGVFVSIVIWINQRLYRKTFGISKTISKETQAQYVKRKEHDQRFGK